MVDNRAELERTQLPREESRSGAVISSDIPLPTSLQGVTRPQRPAAFAHVLLKIVCSPGIGQEEGEGKRLARASWLKNILDSSHVPQHQPQSKAPDQDGLAWIVTCKPPWKSYFHNKALITFFPA
jgi:hypothetical protein